jgi:hypothetical protein
MDGPIETVVPQHLRIGHLIGTKAKTAVPRYRNIRSGSPDCIGKTAETRVDWKRLGIAVNRIIHRKLIYRPGGEVVPRAESTDLEPPSDSRQLSL